MLHRHLSVVIVLLGIGGELLALMLMPVPRTYVQTARAASTTPAQIRPAVVVAATTTPHVAAPVALATTTAGPVALLPSQATSTIYQVPFYSQFRDISSKSWEKVGCGITSLAMLIDYYGPAVPVDTLLKEGVADHAYLQSAGWTYAGLIKVGEAHGITGAAHDLSGLRKDAALAALQQALAKGPVMVGVRYLFQPNNPIPHLVIADGIANGRVYYNDPAGSGPGGSISVARFTQAWHGRFITFAPLS